MYNNPDIRYLFEPRGIAIIGASRDQSKIGHKFVRNIAASGYKGKVYPVNPEGGEILGYKVYKSIPEIDGEADIACIVIPAKLVFDSIKSCADKGVKIAVIIAAGFSEIGNTAEEKKIVEYAREHGMRILGPNIFGVYSAAASVNATFGPLNVRPGNVAVITQSGAIGIGMMGKTVTENIGLSAIISVGNKSDISESDLLEYLIAQERTKIILMYIEGVNDGERLVNILKDTSRKKPIVVIKSGRSRRGALAAASHTSSLAGEDKVFDDIIRQCGVLRAETIHDALTWCRYLANTPFPRGENSVIITNGGGIGVLAADACEKFNVNLYDDIQNLTQTFAAVIPSFGSAKNPIDLSGQAPASYYDSALTAALANKSIHSVICLACETAVFDPDGFSQVVRKQMVEYATKKPLVFSLFGGEKMEHYIQEFQKQDIPAFQDVYESASLLGAVYSYYRTRNTPADPIQEVDIDYDKINEIIRKVRTDNRTFLLASEAEAIVQMAGIPIPRSRLAHSLEEAIRFAEEIGYPIVMKIVSRDIIHKSESGGIALDLENRKEVIDAYEAILHNVREYNPTAHIDGISVNEMVRDEIETIIGARRDRSFGPIVMFGLGGIYVEVMRDIAFRTFPLGRDETLKMISQIRSYPLLLGVRGEKRKDIDKVVEIIMRVGSILQKCEDISDIELNPLVVYSQGEGVRAVDVRILLSKPQEAAQ
jgi:acetyl coenzyme A synthetase (ADP forming)-like protein